MTAIITVTQGDWQYLKEWIEYHHGIGVDFIYIAYNGKTEYFSKLPKYDYVRYMDISTNFSNHLYDELDRRGKGFSGWGKAEETIYQLPFMQKVENIMMDTIRYLYPEIKYLCIIDTDEYICIPSKQNINDFLSTHMPEANSSYCMKMRFYGDNGLIYNDYRSVIERFYNDNNYHKVFDGGFAHRKIIINLKHPHTIDNRCFLISPHSCRMACTQFTFNENTIYLAHFWTMTIEEWISKLNPDIDADYLNRFRGNVFREFFYGVCHNDITPEKLRAIPELLNKYHVDYKPEIEEYNPSFVKAYKEANNL